MADRSDNDRLWRRGLRYSALGIEMGLAVAIGYLAGDWLDGELDTGPYLTIVFALFGVVAGMRELYYAARRAMREDMDGDD